MSKIVSLQILRGVAATSVVGFHLQAAAKAEGADPGIFSLFSGGGIGVDIFFVISGFIIFYVASTREYTSRLDFLKARFWRIFPPYWAVLTLYILAAIGMAVFLGDSGKLPDLRSLLVSYLLLPYPDHIIVIAWTLTLELIFYLIFALTFVRGNPKALIVAMLVWILASQIFALAVDDKPLYLSLLLHRAVLEFLFGIMIAMYFLSVPEDARRFQMTSLVVGGIAVVVYSVNGGYHLGPFGREITAGIPSALLVYGALGLKTRWSPNLETWGESSYTLYLFHVLYFSVVGKLIEVLFDINVYHSQTFMCALFFSVIAICYLATVKIERPYQLWYKSNA